MGCPPSISGWIRPFSLVSKGFYQSWNMFVSLDHTEKPFKASFCPDLCILTQAISIWKRRVDFPSVLRVFSTHQKWLTTFDLQEMLFMGKAVNSVSQNNRARWR